MDLLEIQNYTEYLFRVALKKFGNLDDAEDLTQEVLLAAFQYPKEIIDMKSWLSIVLNNKYYDMLRKKYKFPTVSIDLVPEEAEPWEIWDVDDRPDDACVRREVAYLADKYRTVIISHYLDGEKVHNIAKSLGVPKGTVLSRLSSGREQMRKGFEKMESYEKQSYQPDKLDISCYGYPGFHDEPWSLITGDLMKQNILIIAYDKPLTVIEIARALGIPTAYVEKSVHDLVASELMKDVGNKYFTDFMILKPEQCLKNLDTEIAFVETHYDELIKNVNEYLAKLRAQDFLVQLTYTKRKKLEYYFILHLFSSAIYLATQRIIPSKEDYPQRPDGGKWIAIGSQYPQDFDFENYRFRKYCYGGERRARWNNFLNSKSIELRVYDTQPDLNKYEHGPIEIHDDNLVKLLYIISRGIPFNSTGFNLMFCESIPHLVECGILDNTEGKPNVAIPIITPDEYRVLDDVRMKQMHLLADILEPKLKDLFPKFKIAIPKHLECRIAEFRQYSCYATPMAFIKKAIECGDFDSNDATPPMVFIVEDENKMIR